MFLDFEGASLYEFAMSLFMEAGHVFTSIPEYCNHSAEQFAYLDNQRELSYSLADRALLKRFNNVSRLFTVNGCAFFSINLLANRAERSELAHHIHTLFHPIVDVDGTICLFRLDNEVMLSFMGFSHHCILSDWYPMFDPYEELLHRLDIINMCIDSSRGYFDDMIYGLARAYYMVGENGLSLALLPTDCFVRLERDEITRDDLDEFIREERLSAYRQYGDDYVEYDESAPIRNDETDSELDLLLLDMDTDMDENDNPLGGDIEEDEDGFDSDDEEFLTRDEYEFDDIDPEVFRDPTLLIKLLKKREQDDNDIFP